MELNLKTCEPIEKQSTCKFRSLLSIFSEGSSNGVEFESM